MANFLSAASSALYSKVVARSWSDENFRRDLLADPKTVLMKEGLDFLETFEVEVVPGADRAHFDKDTVKLPLPNKPKDLDDEALRSVLAKWPNTDAIAC